MINQEIIRDLKVEILAPDDENLIKIEKAKKSSL